MTAQERVAFHRQQLRQRLGLVAQGKVFSTGMERLFEDSDLVVTTGESKESNMGNRAKVGRIRSEPWSSTYLQDITFCFSLYLSLSLTRAHARTHTHVHAQHTHARAHTHAYAQHTHACTHAHTHTHTPHTPHTPKTPEVRELNALQLSGMSARERNRAKRKAKQMARRSSNDTDGTERKCVGIARSQNRPFYSLSSVTTVAC